MTPHEHDEVDIDLLADYIGGALDGATAAAVARLVAEHPRWREDHDLLAPRMTAVHSDLRALGAEPEPMPPDLMDRLTAAFAAPPAEPASMAGVPAAAEKPDPHPARPERHLKPVPDNGLASRPHPRRRLRWAGSIAVAAGVLAFAGFGVDHLANQPNSADQASTAGSAERAAPMLGTDSAGSSALVTPPGDDQILATATDYTAASLRALPGSALRKPDAASQNNTSVGADEWRAAEPGLDALSRLRSPDALLACLEAVAVQHGGGPITVQSVDYARYEGAPALVVRFLAGGGQWASATGPDCGASGRGADLRKTVQVG